jgi:hypothetical protein
VQIVSVIDRAARDWVRVALSGGVETVTETAIMRSALGAMLRARPRGMSVNIGGLEQVGEAGLAELRRAVLQAADDGTWIELVNAPLPLHRQLAADPVLSPVLEAYAWKRPGERTRPTRPRVPAVR